MIQALPEKYLPHVDLAENLEASPDPRVTKDGIEAKIESYRFTRGTTGTICVVTMKNDFKVIGKSACSSPENCNQAIGERSAYDDAFNQLWSFEAYLLHEELAIADGRCGSCPDDEGDPRTPEYGVAV